MPKGVGRFDIINSRLYHVLMYVPPEPLRNLLDEIVPDLYVSVAEGLGIPLRHPNEMAFSNQCEALTKALLGALVTRQRLPARREFHRPCSGDQRYHYLVAHEPKDAPPTDDDLITDLNPWQYLKDRDLRRSFLHGTRQEVMDTLREGKAPEWYIGCRSVETIVSVG